MTNKTIEKVSELVDALTEEVLGLYKANSESTSWVGDGVNGLSLSDELPVSLEQRAEDYFGPEFREINKGVKINPAMKTLYKALACAESVRQYAEQLAAVNR